MKARELGIPFDGTTGELNAITDVQGVEVGHATLIKGDGLLQVGQGPIRTGVTAIFPLGKQATEGVAANWFALNGVGEMTGTVFVEEYGTLFGPIMLTNTLSVGAVRDAVIRWSMSQIEDAETLFSRSLPLVAETFDGYLNDIYGFHIADEHVFAALNGAQSGAVAEGNVGGGTGMVAHFFKGGIGTSSRVVEVEAGTFTVGALVQANHGSREDLVIAGVPVGKAITDLMPEQRLPNVEGHSIVMIVATDAPFLPYQLKRIAKRAAMGLARTGSFAENSSGDIVFAFSTANRTTMDQADLGQYQFIRNEQIDPFFKATVEAVEESIVNALVSAETMTGANGITFHGLPHERVLDLLKKYNRL